MGIEKYQFLKFDVGIMFQQQTLESILSKMLHQANEGQLCAPWCLSSTLVIVMNDKLVV